jgi:hypothetical protein
MTDTPGSPVGDDERKGDLPTLVRRLQPEVGYLLLRWSDWRALFATNEDRVSLLNKSARTFFSGLQGILASDVKIGLARLTDPASTGKRANLTLRRIGDVLTTRGAAGADRFHEALTEIEELTKPVRDERNRRIVHIDLRAAIQLAPEPGAMTIAQIGRATELIVECMSIAETAAGVPPSDYDGWGDRGGTDSLFRALAKAKAYDRLRDEGKIPQNTRVVVP